MTTAAVDVIARAARLGVVLRIEGGRIVARPKGAITAELRAAVDAHRADVVVLLAVAVAPPQTACWNCRGTRFFARPERLTWICSRCHPPADAAAMVWHDATAEVRGA